jgi:hypothetical protein
MATKKDFKGLRKAALAAGWRIEATAGKKGHEWWIAPNGARILTSPDPSDHNGIKNHIARMRRLGGWKG